MLVLYNTQLVTHHCAKNINELFPNLDLPQKVIVLLVDDPETKFVMAMYKNKPIGYLKITDAIKYRDYLEENNITKDQEVQAKVEKTIYGYLVYLALEN